MISKNYTCKLPVEGSEFLGILNSDWTNSNIKLLLIHNNQAWNGMFQIDDNEDVAELLDQLSLTEESYMEETSNALTTHGGAQQFAYMIENDTFTWKKYVRTNMAVKFGYVLLSKVPVFEAFETIIDNTLHSSVKTNERLSDVNKEIKTLKEENLSLKNKLQDVIEKKNEMENTLYCQFLSVLNAKKKKIEELKKKIGNTNENGINEYHNDSDLDHHSSDPFNSDTELDSEEEKEKHSPTKLEVVGNRDSLEIEEQNIYIPPKRSRKRNDQEHIPGPSGRNIQGRSTKNVSKCKLQAKKDMCTTNNKSIEKKSIGRKSDRKSCVLGTIQKEKDVNNSDDDDAFMFPKRSKKSSKEIKLAKPSSSKINYESNDETYLDTSVKLEPSDSDNTPSEIDITEQNVTVKTEKSNKTNMNRRTDDQKMEAENDRNKHSNELSQPVATSCKGYSSSTLDILNQLV
ncbi:uncharacterized protein PFB0765w-like isoform X1 [Homalodisca vitripennis]|uniref:uncharacterized protein PFB0765w-like isoform X1 n=1 Tax=Homalodisca vitripennis TaxID=197043 RepID=UPI001EEC3931|nr:uncharacterized protein PFB0765w-like isoform X1 [Homalodisca vitripennis]